MRARRRDRSGESGQALLELALVVPLLVLLVMAIFQFAYVLESQMGLTNAVREAARRTRRQPRPRTRPGHPRVVEFSELYGDVRHL